MPIFTRPDDEYYPLAASIAERRGTNVVESLDAIEGGQVLYVGDPTSIEESVLIQLQDRLEREGPVDGGFSIVTGRTIEEARRLYEAEDEHDGDVVASQHTAPDGQTFDPDTQYLEGGEVTASNIADVGQEGAHSLVLHSNGWPIHLNLSEGFLCGVPSDHEQWEFPGDQPYCVEDGAVDCPLDETVVKSDSLSFDHVFVESCSSAIANSTSGLPVHVVLGLLEGSSSLIGAYRPGPTTYPEIVLYHSLLRAGYSLVEICYVLNRTATLNGVMAYPYVPFGAPDAASAHARPASVEYEVSGNEIRVSEASGPVIDVRMALDERPESDRYYLSADGLDSPLYYTAFEENGDLRVLCYRGRQFDNDAVTLTVHADPPEQETLDLLVDALEGGRRTRQMNLASDSFETRHDNLEAQLESLGQKTSVCKQNAARYDVVEDRIRQPVGNLEAMHDDLAEYAAQGDYLYYKYGAVAIDDDAFRTDADCHRCGRPAFAKTVSDTTGGARRAIGNCPQCGHIYDVPHAGDRDGPEYPEIDGDLDAGTGTVRSIDISFRNPRSVPMRARFVPSILKLGASRGDREFFTPTSETVTLDAGESTTRSFDLDTRLLYDNQHFVVGRIVGNGRLYSGRSVLFVGDSTGHLRPNQR